MGNRNKKLLAPNFLKKIEAWVFDCAREDIFIFGTDMFRTAEEQNALYQIGASPLDGYINKSMHQSGLAVDIAFKGMELYPKDIEIWRKVAKIAKRHGIDWLKDLDPNTNDWCHFQCDGTIYKPSITKKNKMKGKREVNIESAYLNADQEQKVENVINLAKDRGFNVNFGKVQIPKGLGSMRVLVEASSACLYLMLCNLREDSEEIENAVNQFEEVYNREYDQVVAGTQKFVAEREEAGQK